jgi:FlaA1/EpsC-like NDP-sugar epimerase
LFATLYALANFNKTKNMMKQTLKYPRRFFALMHDVSAAVAALFAAYLLRFNFDIPAEHLHVMRQSLPWVVALQLAAFIYFGLYRGVWRFASVPDLKRIVFAISSSAILLVALMFMFNRGALLPRSVLILDPLMLMLMMGGSRVLYRA